jgi:mRNA-degrading endonuclease RelE of RelBE toxin-antitoxin system
MTRACEKLFKKLPRNQQEAIKNRILEICKEPFCGDKFRDASMQGLLHTHARGSASDLLVIWSVQDNPEKQIVVEGVGHHKMLDKMQLRRTTFNIR